VIAPVSGAVVGQPVHGEQADHRREQHDGASG
jgi:hypothetical protein